MSSFKYKMTDSNLEHLHNAIMEVVNNQISSNTPKETKATLTRLVSEGHTEEQALSLIAHVVAAEIFGVLSEGRNYNEKRYIAALQALPDLPWENDS